MPERQATQRKEPPPKPRKKAELAKTSDYRVPDKHLTRQDNGLVTQEPNGTSISPRPASPSDRIPLSQSELATSSPKPLQHVHSISRNNHTLGVSSLASSSIPSTPPDVSTTYERTGNHRILYKAAIMESKAENRVNRYSWMPFEGLLNSNHPDRENLAVMDIITKVWGSWPSDARKRRDQLRHNFAKVDDDEPFIFGRHFTCRESDGRFPTIRMHSVRMLETLRSLVHYYPEVSGTLEESEVKFYWPYCLLFHYYVELQKARSECMTLQKLEPTTDLIDSTNAMRKDFATREDLDVVLEYLRPIYEKEIKPQLEAHERKVTDFDHIWLLFKPGSTVFARVNDVLMFFKVLGGETRVTKDTAPRGDYIIHVWGLYSNGCFLKRGSRKFTVKSFIGERDIHMLPVIPIRYLEHEERKFIKRGKLYHELMCNAPLHRRYEGPVNGDKRDRVSIML